MLLDDEETKINLSDLFSDVDANDTLTLTVTGLPSGLTYSERTDLGGTPDDTSDDTLTEKSPAHRTLRANLRSRLWRMMATVG